MWAGVEVVQLFGSQGFWLHQVLGVWWLGQQEIQCSRRVWQPALASTLQYSCLETPLPDREAWQATVYRVEKSRTGLKWPCVHKHKTFFFFFFLFLAVATLPQWELSVKVVQLLGLQGPWRHQVCRDTDCLCGKSYGPTRVIFWASCSWWSEGLLGQSFSIALPVQALRGLLCLGSFCAAPRVRHIEGPPWLGSHSVHQRIRHLKGHPGYGLTLV